MTDTSGEPVSDRILTAPNAVSVGRLALVPVFLALLAADQRIAAALVLAVIGATDWIDGTLARRLGQVTRLGRILDPLVDRVTIVATLIGLAVATVIPWWLVAVLAAREAYLLALVPVLRRRGLLALPVHFVGKAGTFILFWGLPLVLGGSAGGPVLDVVATIGWALVGWGLIVYVYAAVLYTDQTVRLARDYPRATALPPPSAGQ